MVRRGMLLLAAVVVALAVAAPAASAKVKLAGGSTTLKLYSSTARALEGAGVAVGPTRPARVRRGGVAFPITGGSIDPRSARGQILHRGGLALRAHGTRVVLRNPRVHVGRRSATLRVRVGRAGITALRLSLRRARVTRQGLGTTVSGIRAVLTGQAARALNAAFRTSLFSRGLPIGRVTVRARPSQAELAGGRTGLALDPGAAAALTAQGIQAAPIAPAFASGGELQFPITGGNVDARTFAGRINHSGGIRLTRGSTSVSLTSFRINIDSAPDLTARVGTARVSILKLDLSQLTRRVRGRSITLGGVRARLTREAADALNRAFGTTAFREDLLLGVATVRARAR